MFDVIGKLKKKSNQLKLKLLKRKMDFHIRRTIKIKAHRLATIVQIVYSMGDTPNNEELRSLTRLLYLYDSESQKLESYLQTARKYCE